MCIIIWFMQLCYKFLVIYWFYWYLLNFSLFFWIILLIYLLIECFILVCIKDLGQVGFNLFILLGNMVCQIGEFCIFLDCCIGVFIIQYNFYVYLDIDFCNFVIKFGIDRLEFVIYMQEFIFGIEKDFRFVNVVRIK